jgi:nucleotide-binding universal stress UspA family protein
MQLRQVEVERLAERLRQRFPNWQVTEEVRADSPGWAIIRRAEGWENECHADLVVLGTTDKSIVSRMLLGSVSQQVMTFARCSVRIVRPRGTSASRVSRLVIGVDGSPNADWAVQAICRRVWVAGSEARVVCVPNSKMMAIPHIKALGVTSTKAAAEVIVERATLELRAAGLAVASYVTEGEPKHELVKQAEEFAADCLVVGARGLTRMERILLGSVSLAVAMRASCSVEVVRTAARSDVDLTLAECPL